MIRCGVRPEEKRSLSILFSALRGNRTPGGSNQESLGQHGNDPGYHYPINAYPLSFVYLRLDCNGCLKRWKSHWALLFAPIRLPVGECGVYCPSCPCIPPILRHSIHREPSVIESIQCTVESSSSSSFHPVFSQLQTRPDQVASRSDR